MLFIHNYTQKTTKFTEDQIDYSKYLGPDWKKNKFKGKKISTMCGNHHSYLDHIVPVINPHLEAIAPIFTPAAFVKNLPIGHFYV